MKQIKKILYALTQAAAVIFYILLIKSSIYYFSNKDSSFLFTFLIISIILQSIALLLKNKYPKVTDKVEKEHNKIYLWIAVVIIVLFLLALTIPTLYFVYFNK